MNSTSSGSCHLATRGARKSRIVLLGQLGAGLEHDAGQRALRPLRVGHADDRRLADLRVGHQLVLQLDRRDPLAAGLDQVLGAVDEADAAALVHRRHVAGAQPAVVGEAVAGPRVVVVGRRDPRCRGTAARRSPSPSCGTGSSVSGSTTRHSTPNAPRPTPVRRSACSSSGSERWSASRWQTDTTGLVSVIPHACRIGRPSCSRYASDSACGTAEPPHGIARRCDVSRPFSSGSTCIQIVGTPAATVTRSSTTRSAIACPTGRGRA